MTYITLFTVLAAQTVIEFKCFRLGKNIDGCRKVHGNIQVHLYLAKVHAHTKAAQHTGQFLTILGEMLKMESHFFLTNL